MLGKPEKQGQVWVDRGMDQIFHFGRGVQGSGIHVSIIYSLIIISRYILVRVYIYIQQLALYNLLGSNVWPRFEAAKFMAGWVDNLDGDDVSESGGLDEEGEDEQKVPGSSWLTVWEKTSATHSSNIPCCKFALFKLIPFDAGFILELCELYLYVYIPRKFFWLVSQLNWEKLSLKMPTFGDWRRGGLALTQAEVKALMAFGIPLVMCGTQLMITIKGIMLELA